MDTKKTGKAIAFLRKRCRITQTQLAEMLGISDKAVSKWERGLSLPDTSILNKLAIVLDSDIESLLDGKVGGESSSWKGLIFFDTNINPLIKIQKESVFSVQLFYFYLAGVRNITVVCKKEYFAGLRKENPKKDFFNLTFITKDHFQIEKDIKNIMLIQKPLFLYGVDLTRKMRWAMEKKSGTTQLAVYCPKYSMGVIECDSDFRIKNSNRENKGEVTLVDFERLPFLFLKDPFNYFKDGKIDFIEPLQRGTIKFSMNSVSELKSITDFMELMEKNMGVKVNQFSN